MDVFPEIISAPPRLGVRITAPLPSKVPFGGLGFPQAQIGLGQELVGAGRVAQGQRTLELQGGFVEAVELQQHATEFQVGAGGIRVARQCGMEGFERLRGAGLAVEEDAVVDARIFVGCGRAHQPDGGTEFGFGFGGASQGFERESEQTVALGGLPGGEGAAKGCNGGGKAVQQVQRAAVVEAGILECRLPLAGVTEGGFGGLVVTLRGVDHTEGFPGGGIPRFEAHTLTQRDDRGLWLTLRKEPDSLLKQGLGVLGRERFRIQKP